MSDFECRMVKVIIQDPKSEMVRGMWKANLKSEIRNSRQSRIRRGQRVPECGMKIRNPKSQIRNQA